MSLKKVNKIFLSISIFMLALIIAGCNVTKPEEPAGGNGDSTGNIGSTGKPVKNGAIAVTDGSSNNLGELKSIGELSLTFKTPAGHYVQYNWDGSISEAAVYFTELNGGGTPFYHTYYPGESDHQLFYANGKLYKIKNVASDGSAIVNTNKISCKSRWDSKLQSYGAKSGNIDKWVELVETSRVDVGVPAVISAPFIITPVQGSSVEVRDADNNLLGYNIGSDGLYLLTSKGYLLSLTDEGTLFDISLYFTGSNGSGTPLYHATESIECGKMATLVNGKYYRIKTVNADGTAKVETSQANCQSRWDSYNNKYNNNLGSWEKNPEKWIEYIEATPADLGLPATIKLPLNFKK